MTKVDFIIPIYKVQVVAIEFSNDDTYESIDEEIINELDGDGDETLMGWFDEEAKDQGVVVKVSAHKIYAFFTPQTTIEERFNTYFHEVRHITDHIADDHDIECNEAKAYLQGYIGEQLMPLMMYSYGIQAL